MNHPDQIVEAHGGLVSYQCLSTKNGKPGLLRAIINDASNPKNIVTIYRTSKIKKYWKAAPFGAVVARVPLILDNAWKKASGFVPGSGGEYDYAPAQG